jgi:hypothetical protein
MPDIPATIAEIDDRIAAAQETFASWSSKQRHTPVRRTKT